MIFTHLEVARLLSSNLIAILDNLFSTELWWKNRYQIAKSILLNASRADVHIRKLPYCNLSVPLVARGHIKRGGFDNAIKYFSIFDIES